ncbi:MAG: sulfur carrier protein ThiS [Bryobacteraceae bacterium]|nr:sulfur carrier protein ThiS [Bryobacteraceae bacterium]
MSNQIKTIWVVLNGERREVPEGLTIATFLSHLGLPEGRVAVELDRQIVRKTDWNSKLVAEGAQVEVVHFVGGGRA